MNVTKLTPFRLTRNLIIIMYIYHALINTLSDRMIHMNLNMICGVQSNRRCENHESCVCIVGVPACGCQKKSVVTRRSVDMQQFREVSRTTTTYSTETHTSDFILIMF